MSPSAQVDEFLSFINSLGQPPLREQGPEAARAGYHQLAATPGPEVAWVRNETVTTGQHGDFAVRCYRGLDAGDDPVGVLVWIHGGGFVIGDLDTADSTCRALANEARIVVVSVDYHLSPEHPFPVAIDDAMAALAWVVDRADELGVDASKLAVGGDSAGGNLSAVACHLARAAHHPDVVFQLLVYPVVDLAGSYPSRVENASGYLLTAADMEWFGEQYLAGRDPATPRVSPLLAADLGGLPPAMVITAQFDPLRDEGAAYAEALRAAGVDVESMHFDDQIHGFFDLDFLDDCAVARIRAAAALRAAFNGTAS